MDPTITDRKFLEFIQAATESVVERADDFAIEIGDEGSSEEEKLIDEIKKQLTTIFTPLWSK